MAARSRLTNNTDETEVARLFSSDVVFTIPYFQRAYKWKSDKLRQLNDDVLSLVDGTSDFHFLGAIIVHGRKSNPSDPTPYDVIDGQQRITTLILYLCATVKALCELGEYSEAAAIFLKYLAINRDTGSIPNYRLHSCKEDRAQLNWVYKDLLSDEKFLAALGGFKLIQLPSSGSDRGALKSNYQASVKFLREEEKQGGIGRIRDIYKCLLEKISVVQIDVWDPINGPKIFDSLNARQEPITTGDLIRNEIFARVANESPTKIEQIDATYWQPFYLGFEFDGRNYFDGYFFPYGLIQNANLKKSEVYAHLRSKWDGMADPIKIIEELSQYQKPYMDIRCGKNLCGFPKSLATSIEKLRQTGLPTSVFPFLMQLLSAAQKGSITPEAVESVLALLESFLVRRAICGQEPTGLHAVFKRLWTDCDGDLSVERVTKEISKHKTVTWPTAAEFSEAVKTRPLYTPGSDIVRHFLLEYDLSLGGDPGASDFWVEHILPRTVESTWSAAFSTKEHADLKDVLANLLPTSDNMNRSLGNSPFTDKKARYKTDSAYKSTRLFAEQFIAWTPSEIAQRAETLAAWAVKRWPHEKAS